MQSIQEVKNKSRNIISLRAINLQLFYAHKMIDMRLNIKKAQVMGCEIFEKYCSKNDFFLIFASL